MGQVLWRMTEARKDIERYLFNDNHDYDLNGSNRYQYIKEKKPYYDSFRSLTGAKTDQSLEDLLKDDDNHFIFGSHPYLLDFTVSAFIISSLDSGKYLPLLMDCQNLADIRKYCSNYPCLVTGNISNLNHEEKEKVFREIRELERSNAKIIIVDQAPEYRYRELWPQPHHWIPSKEYIRSHFFPPRFIDQLQHLENLTKYENYASAIILWGKLFKRFGHFSWIKRQLLEKISEIHEKWSKKKTKFFLSPQQSDNLQSLSRLLSGDDQKIMELLEQNNRVEKTNDCPGVLLALRWSKGDEKEQENWLVVKGIPTHVQKVGTGIWQEIHKANGDFLEHWIQDRFSKKQKEQKWAKIRYCGFGDLTLAEEYDASFAGLAYLVCVFAELFDKKTKRDIAYLGQISKDAEKINCKIFHIPAALSAIIGNYPYIRNITISSPTSQKKDVVSPDFFSEVSIVIMLEKEIIDKMEQEFFNDSNEIIDHIKYILHGSHHNLLVLKDGNLNLEQFLTNSKNSSQPYFIDVDIENQAQKNIPWNKLLAAKQSLALVGCYGAGKTTLQMALFYQAFQKGYLPIWLKTKQRETNVWRLLESTLYLEANSGMEWVSAQKSRIILFCDLNEMERVQDRILLLSHIHEERSNPKFPQVIIAYRSLEQNDQAFRQIEQDFTIFYLKPLSVTKATEYYSRIRKQDNVNASVLEQFFQNYRNMVEIPLLLHFLTMVGSEGINHIGQLYWKVLGYLLKQGLRDAPYEYNSQRKLCQKLVEIAKNLQEKWRVSFSGSELNKWAKDQSEKVIKHGPLRSQAIDDETKYQLLHDSFVPFLAGLDLIIDFDNLHEDEWNTKPISIRENFQDKILEKTKEAPVYWTTPIALIVGLLEADHIKEFLKRINVNSDGEISVAVNIGISYPSLLWQWIKDLPTQTKNNIANKFLHLYDENDKQLQSILIQMLSHSDIRNTGIKKILMLKKPNHEILEFIIFETVNLLDLSPNELLLKKYTIDQLAKRKISDNKKLRKILKKLLSEDVGIISHLSKNIINFIRQHFEQVQEFLTNETLLLDENAKMFIVENLMSFVEKDVKKIVIKWASDTNAMVRKYSISYLLQIIKENEKDNEALEQLVQLASNQNPSVRHQAIDGLIILAEQQNQYALSTLEQLKDPYAKTCLEKITPTFDDGYINSESLEDTGEYMIDMELNSDASQSNEIDNFGDFIANNQRDLLLKLLSRYNLDKQHYDRDKLLKFMENPQVLDDIVNHVLPDHYANGRFSFSWYIWNLLWTTLLDNVISSEHEQNINILMKSSLAQSDTVEKLLEKAAKKNEIERKSIAILLKNNDTGIKIRSLKVLINLPKWNLQEQSALLQLSQDLSSEIRNLAIKGLARLAKNGNKQAYLSIIQLISDSDSQVQNSASSTLQNISFKVDQEIIDKLLSLFFKESYFIKNCIQNTLMRLVKVSSQKENKILLDNLIDFIEEINSTRLVSLSEGTNFPREIWKPFIAICQKARYEDLLYYKTSLLQIKKHYIGELQQHNLEIARDFLDLLQKSGCLQ